MSTMDVIPDIASKSESNSLLPALLAITIFLFLTVCLLPVRKHTKQQQ